MTNQDDSAINLNRVRLYIVIGIGLMCSFIIADLDMLPPSLHDTYLDSRLFMQTPVGLVFLALTFTPFYPRLHQWVISIAMLLITYTNYWLILHCWTEEQFAFSYEGTVMYSLFALFVLRLRFRFAVPFVSLVVLGFAILVLTLPIYGDRNTVSLGFVVSSLILGLIGVQQIESAIKKLAKTNARLMDLSQIDQLTNILNRGTYESRFSEQVEFNKRSGNTMGVFLIDLDNFKDYNDGYGHQQGDNIIMLQANMLSRTFKRSTDIVARYGGEEFVVVTSNITAEQCERFAAQLIAQWETQKAPHGKSTNQPFVTCSIGYHVETISQQSDKDTMVNNADKALYQAKAQGRNRAVCYSGDSQ